MRLLSTQHRCNLRLPTVVILILTVVWHLENLAEAGVRISLYIVRALGSCLWAIELEILQTQHLISTCIRRLNRVSDQDSVSICNCTHGVGISLILASSIHIGVAETTSFVKLLSMMIKEVISASDKSLLLALIETYVVSSSLVTAFWSLILSSRAHSLHLSGAIW